MRLLLDTHILVWWHENNPRLSKQARKFLKDNDDVFVSMTSLWEIAIKLSIKRFTLSIPKQLIELLDDFKLLEIDIKHAQKVMELPWYHRDPFDRMLIAQAQCDHLHLATDDRMIARYDVQRFEV